MGNIKEIDIKNQTYYFFDDMINIKDFDRSLLKIDKKWYKNINTYYIGYITKKNSGYVNIHSVNPLYLIIGEADGSIEYSSTKEKNGNKYLTFADTDKNKEVWKKYTELWGEIEYHIKTINAGECNSVEPREYEKDYMKIKFNSDNLPLNKILKFII